MRIVDRATFLAMPAGTVFAKFSPYIFGDIAIKGDTVAGKDFYVQSIADAITHNDSAEFVANLDRARTESVPVDLDFEGRDGLFDADQLFAVWDRADVEALIARLERAIDKTPIDREWMNR